MIFGLQLATNPSRAGPESGGELEVLFLPSWQKDIVWRCLVFLVKPRLGGYCSSQVLKRWAERGTESDRK